MSGGLNKNFNKNPHRFFKSNFVTLQDHLNVKFIQDCNLTNPVELNFRKHPSVSACLKIGPSSHSPMEHVELTFYSEDECLGNTGRKRKSRGTFTYFLPNKHRKLSEIRLGSDAVLFITPALSGCLLAFERSENPRILHIDGGLREDDCYRRAANYFGTVPYDIYNPEESDEYQYELVYGLRAPQTGWLFYSQKYNTSAKNMRIETGISPKTERALYHTKVADNALISMSAPLALTPPQFLPENGSTTEAESSSATEPGSSDEDSVDE